MVAGVNRSYTDEEIAHAAAVYAINGDSVSTSKLLAIPESTIRTWVQVNNPVFVTHHDLARKEHGDRIRAGLAQVIDKAVTNMASSLQDGDEVVSFDKEGNVRRANKRMSGKDTAIVAAIAIDKLAILSGKTPQHQAEDRLQALADKLERLADQGRVVSTD